ncbi:hypothetical protein WICPIJ_003827 [Wickerhamomyces pijperi]|uniref:Very long-chain fatty acid transport protein n=1 Tax=Wickerhamomyces pijperi TaxID=599730 RepID=A0A9P8Q6V7_WICPI|nr:hypothetical protein WICPIJ_003827 [Wickerhamomyces pijperi]
MSQLIPESIQNKYHNIIETLANYNETHQITTDIKLITWVVQRILLHLTMSIRGEFSYWYYFESMVKSQPSNMALSFIKPTTTPGFELENYTFQETYDIVLRLSSILVEEYGLQSGDVIGMDYTNKPMFVFLWFACWNLGVTPAFLNTNVFGEPLRHCLNTAEVSQFFVCTELSERVKEEEKEILARCQGVKVNYVDDEQLLHRILNENCSKYRESDDIRNKSNSTDYSTAALIFTSGTTGLPKPAIMSWRKAGFGASLYSYIVQINPQAIVYTSMPLYHSTASILGLCSTWLRGGCVALAVKFSVSTIWDQCCLSKATHLQYVGEVCRYLLNSKKHPLEREHSLKVAYGNGLRADVWAEFKDRFSIEHIGEFYASTESPFALTNFQSGDVGVGACRKYGSIINKILSYQQCLIKMDPEDSSQVYRNAAGFCEVVGSGENGELIMNLFFAANSKKMFQGYKNNTEESQSKVLRNVFRTGDAWFRSGDLLKKDHFDYWYFVDRLGDTFRWKSENVSTNEVELIISNAAHGSIEEVVVVGVRIPGYEGRAGYAVIKDKSASAEQHDMLLTQIYQSQELTNYSRPIFVKFVSKIKHTDNFKISKKSYKDEKFPAGVSGDEVIYWLDNSQRKYDILTENAWEDIINGKARI